MIYCSVYKICFLRKTDVMKENLTQNLKCVTTQSHCLKNSRKKLIFIECLILFLTFPIHSFKRVPKISIDEYPVIF